MSFRIRKFAAVYATDPDCRGNGPSGKALVDGAALRGCGLRPVTRAKAVAVGAVGRRARIRPAVILIAG
jgi:hypothetical protein